MPDIVLFGATGYTGRLTAAALGRRGASFAVAGRDVARLEAVAASAGAAEIRVADASDFEGVTRAAHGCRVLLTCVGPFTVLGRAAVEAALANRIHYLDSSGEAVFVRRLLERDEEARAAGIAMAPAMGFDEVPCDVAVHDAVQGLERPEVYATYAAPSTPSAGTLRSVLRIVVEPGRCIRDGATRPFLAADERRFAPLPAPLGPKPTFSVPLAIGDLAPLHADMRSFKPFVSGGRARAVAVQAGRPLGALLLSLAPTRRLVDAALARLPEGPDDRARRKKWTIMVEARAERKWRNVALQGEDIYGLTAELLAGGAIALADDGYDRAGVLSPVQAFGADKLREELRAQGVTITVFEGA